MANILITGGTGFAGKYLVKYLNEKGHNLHCIIRDNKKVIDFDSVIVDKMTYSLIEYPENCSIETFKTIIERNNIDTIIHNAAIAREYPISEDDYRKVNVIWTKNLAQAFIDSEIEHNKFIYISSVGVYGTNPSVCPANENMPYNPDGKYHNSKMMAEIELANLYDYCKFQNNKFPLIILRPSIMYGINDYGFVYKIFKLISNGKFPLSTKNYKIHLLDLNNFSRIIDIIINENIIEYDNYIYNVSDKNPIEMESLLKFIKDRVGGGYIRLPTIFFSLLSLAGKISPSLNTKLKLISNNWYYNTNHLENDFDIDLNDTFSSLEMYLDWYKAEIKK